MTKSFLAEQSAIADMVAYAVRMLSNHELNHHLVEEYRLLIEELTTKLVEKAKPNASIKMQIYRQLGAIHIAFDCPGSMVILEPEDEMDFGGRILAEYKNYLSQSYSSGVNHIKFSSNAADKTLLYNIAAVVIATITAIALHALCSAELVDFLKTDLVFPVIVAFTRCIQMLATPVAFFSLATFIVKIQLTLNRDARIARLAGRYVTTSVLAILASLLSWLLLRNVVPLAGTTLQTQNDNFMGDSLSEVLLNLIGNNIIEPFTLANPVPMLVLSVLSGLAAGSLFGRDGIKTRNAIETCNHFFCRMLNLAYTVLPLFLFFSFLHLYLDKDFHLILRVLLVQLLLLVPMTIALAVYTVQLRISGIRLRDFLKDYGEVLLGNLKIGSNVEALPYNRRMLSRKTAMQRGYLNEALELGSIMNMDGSCLMISAGILWQITMADVSLTLSQIIGISVILLLLSLGAPNQPGSFLICMAVLTSYVGISTEMYSVSLVSEAFLGKLYSTINSVGDITTIVSEWSQMRRKES